MNKCPYNRNNKCHCNSGYKHKKCCLIKEEGFVKLEDGSYKYIGFFRKLTNKMKLGIA